MVASAKGHLAVLKLMLEKKGLEINACDSFGVNAFWIAAFYEVVKRFFFFKHLVHTFII